MHLEIANRGSLGQIGFWRGQIYKSFLSIVHNLVFFLQIVLQQAQSQNVCSLFFFCFSQFENLHYFHTQVQIQSHLTDCVEQEWVKCPSPEVINNTKGQQSKPRVLEGHPTVPWGCHTTQESRAELRKNVRTPGRFKSEFTLVLSLRQPDLKTIWSSSVGC